PGKRPASPRKLEACQARVQVRTTAGQPCLRVRQDVVPSRHEAKQAGFNRTFPTAYTGTRNGHAWSRLVGSHGHSTTHSTAPARCGHSRALLLRRARRYAAGAASDLMSIFQPVSRAASLAFWPSLPIASESW